MSTIEREALKELASGERTDVTFFSSRHGAAVAGRDEDWSDLSARTSNALRSDGFATPAAAARLSDEALLLIRGFGKKGLTELREHQENEEWKARRGLVGRHEADLDSFVATQTVLSAANHEAPPQSENDRMLRFLADGYEQAQRKRIGCGEQIRAVLQGRDETWGEGTEEVAGVEEMLGAIARGEESGPVPILGRMYHRAWSEEQELRKEMERALKDHVCWPWLSQVKGIGPTLACKLLARLDPRKATTASAFWAYAGLATVPGERYACAACGMTRDWPVGYNVTGKHQALGSTASCTGALVKVAGPEDGVRAAQPKPARGQKSTYDAYVKKQMYLVGTGFLKVPRGKYEQVYRAERAKLDRERVGWADGRKHLTALRKTEKLFLSHLWQVWREALGLPVGQPYAISVLGHSEASYVGPWQMIGRY